MSMSHHRHPDLTEDELRAADRLFALLRAEREADVATAPEPAVKTVRPSAPPLAEAS